MLSFSFYFAILIYLIGIIMYMKNGSQNLIYILISLEILLLSIALIAIFISFLYDDILGSLLSLYILPIAGAESAFGLGLLIIYRP